MESRDAGTLDVEKLPDGDDSVQLPSNVDLVAIFWADDEAKVWINDHFVGETRLTPVEVEIPSLYLRSSNVVRARGWDTDLVESGFLFGLYLRRAGVLHPVVVSDDGWTGVSGPVETITYAHSLPDILQAEVIWGETTFGVVEMTRRFGMAQVRDAGGGAGDDFTGGDRRDMSSHAFVAELSVLETERARLRSELKAVASTLSVAAFTGSVDGGALTLGKAGPLKEAVTKPVSEKVKAWSERLPPEHQTLIYPERRRLRGEDAATVAGERVVPAGGVDGRTTVYQPPTDRENRRPGATKGVVAGDGDGLGEADGSGGYPGGGGFAGRASRLGLLIPTLILTAYAVYATRQWRRLSEEVR
ncbi:MAG: hypothetical protein CME19_23305 [Gemmatimonadetes bacterium]|nr:hypothetical protein [Gemmatimonadota bacterium]